MNLGKFAFLVAAAVFAVFLVPRHFTVNGVHLHPKSVPYLVPYLLP